ncbi:ribonuclease H2, subunit C [Pholiota molesta]|nr:ribonuclease H2, subunit C [Pholiota molesta]
MPATKLVISQPTAALPSCTPNLMPFHINYTGPAAVSAFMRVRKLVVEEIEKEPGEMEATNEASASAEKKDDQDAAEDIEMASDAQDSSLTTESSVEATPASALSTSSESQTTVVASESQTPSLLSTSSSLATVAPTTTPTAPPIEDADKRFVSAFRGRTIHGLTIDLPAGFSGLVLQTDDRNQGTSKGSSAAADSKTNPTSKAGEKSSARGKAKKAEEQDAPSTRRRGRLTRSTLPSSSSTQPIEVPGDDRDDEVMADAAGEDTTTNEGDDAAVPDAAGDDDAAATRRLVPMAQFSAFTLWSADRVVDKGRDEYYRSLTEWVALANEIHRVD